MRNWKQSRTAQNACRHKTGKLYPRRIVASVLLFSFSLFSWVGWSPFPSCRFKAFTGLSCPTCGMTRSFHALAHGEFTDAIRFNPMGPAFLLLLLILFAKLFREDSPGRFAKMRIPKPLVRIALALFVGLWLGFGATRILLEIAAAG